MTPLQTFFGDAEHSFRLTPALIVGLEKTCGPLGLICQRVFNRQFAQSDITETIRLALIGEDYGVCIAYDQSIAASTK